MLNSLGFDIYKKYVFYSCNNLKTLTISSNSKLTTIKYRALLDAGLSVDMETLRLPSQLVNIENQVFGRGNYENIFIESNFVAYSSYIICFNIKFY